ncbi:hypothetical protein TNCV_4209371 [Trichonephila clavipes]|nr:hypothetical protein TNCV_4209371 [Trichonephila clavipes]
MALGGSLPQINLGVQDVREGNLKVILSLFFNLSRYKQAQKNSNSVACKNSANTSVTSATAPNVNVAAVVKSGMVAPSLGSDMLSKLPSPFRPSNGRSIPCPSNKDAGSSIPSSSNPSATAGSRKNKMVASSAGQQGKCFCIIYSCDLHAYSLVVFKKLCILQLRFSHDE